MKVMFVFCLMQKFTSNVLFWKCMKAVADANVKFLNPASDWHHMECEDIASWPALIRLTPRSCPFGISSLNASLFGTNTILLLMFMTNII